MPQSGQIIPSYLHPHYETLINDNTQFTETVAQTTEGVRSIFVFSSPKGRDNVLLDMASTSDLEKEYGTPNFKLYGQPMHNAYAFLSSGYGKAWTMRVMPEDSARANVTIIAKVKVDKTDAAKPQFKVRFEAKYHEQLNSVEEIEALTDVLTVTEPDVEGFSTYPIMTFYSLGRGQYGNGFRIRVSSSTQADKENSFKNYRVEVLELEGSLNRKDLFTGTLFPDAVDGTTSLYLADRVNDLEDGSQRVNVFVNEDNLVDIFDLYKTGIDPTTDLTLETFDLLTGKTKAGTPIVGYSAVTTGENVIALDNPEGIPLNGGSEGSFASSTDGAAREDAMDAAYVSAFKGDFDKAILSKRRAPADFLLDAGYSDEVKRALMVLANKRYDAQLYLDAGILNTVTDAIEWGESVVDMGDRIISREMQHYKIRDPFTSKAIPVTMTYLFAYRLPLHFKNFGNHIPFVGETYATVTGALKNTLKPLVDADDLEVKEQLYNLRLNYFQTLAENVYVRGTQGTSQNIWSDLSEENNMHVLLEMKRKIENMVSGLTYDFAEVEDRTRFTETATRIIEPYIGQKVRSAVVEFSMSPYEEERSILHCNLAVVYRTINKRQIIEIDINKRV